MWPFSTKNSETNWAEFIGSSISQSRKQRLIRECQKYDVTPYIDDVSEEASEHNIMRGVASEAEIERRIVAKKAVYNSNKANIIAVLALLMSLISLGVSLWGKPL